VRSIRISLLTVLLSIFIAFPIAYVIARIVPQRWQFLLLAAIMVPSLSSFLIRTYAFIIILNERGPINQTLLSMGVIGAPIPLLYNETAVFIGLLNVYLPWMVLPIFASMHKIAPALYEAAENLGASSWAIWRHLIIPMSLPGVVAGAFLSFIPGVGSYATSMILGGSDAILYANTINAQFSESNNWPFGAALSIILLLVILVFLALYQRFGRLDRLWEG
jgi:ABC-type spermidine/putrescine transport system permease subunit I